MRNKRVILKFCGCGRHFLKNCNQPRTFLGRDSAFKCRIFLTSEVTSSGFHSKASTLKIRIEILRFCSFFQLHHQLQIKGQPWLAFLCQKTYVMPGCDIGDTSFEFQITRLWMPPWLLDADIHATQQIKKERIRYVYILVAFQILQYHCRTTGSPRFLQQN